jgi:hypothetical protein
VGSIGTQYLGGNLRAKMRFGVTSATSGSVIWGLAFDNLTSKTESFAAEVTGSTTINSATTIYTQTISFSNAQADSITTGGAFKLKVARKSADTAVGDAELIGISIEDG